VIPAGAVLIEQQNRLARRTDPGPQARGLDLHQRDETVDLRLVGHEPGQDATEAERVFAELGTHPVLARSRRIALVEHEIDDFENRRQTGVEVSSIGQLEGHARLGESPLGADDPLRDGRRRDQKRSRDLLRCQTAQEPQRERDPRLGRENRMAADEDESQEVVVDRLPDRQIRSRRLLSRLELAGQLLVLALEAHGPTDEVDRPVPRGGHEPGARVVRDARLRPLLERGDERVLRELLREADIAHDSRETGDQPRRLDPPNRVDRAVGGCCRHTSRAIASAAGRPARAGAPPALGARV
jgi:hypothetical protein